MPSTEARHFLRLVFAGSGEFGLPALRALMQRHKIELVITQEDRPAGRARRATPTPVGRFAAEAALPLIKTSDINAVAVGECDAMVVIAFGQKIGSDHVHAPRLGSINLHASLLPRFRGASPIHRAVLEGDAETGNSVIRLAEKMDAGAVLGRSRRPILPAQTTGELHDLLAADGAELILRVLEELASGTSVETQQDEALVTIARKLSRADASIDFANSASKICNQICGLWPWPACRVDLADASGVVLRRLSLARARPCSGEGNRWMPGEIMIDCKVSVGDGSRGIELLEVQPDGGRVMPLDDYRRGHPWHPGLRLVTAQ